MSEQMEEAVSETVLEGVIVDVQPVEEVAATISIADVEAMLALQFPPEEPKAPYVPAKGATWAYATEMDTAERGVPDEWVWERLRLKRNALLSACDFRMVSDAPWDTAAWGAYRQALRDMTDTLDPRKAVWPAEPE